MERFPSRTKLTPHYPRYFTNSTAIESFRSASKVYQNLQQKIVDHYFKKSDYLLSLLYQLPYNIIIFLTVCVYPPTRNSREGPLLR